MGLLVRSLRSQAMHCFMLGCVQKREEPNIPEDLEPCLRTSHFFEPGGSECSAFAVGISPAPVILPHQVPCKIMLLLSPITVPVPVL